MAWAYLALAILLEIVGTGLLKLSHGFERVGTGGLALLAYGVCFFFLALSLRTIPVGAAYAIWAGVGTVLIVLVGVVLFGEKMSLVKAGLIAMIVVGAAGLMLLTEEDSEARGAAAGSPGPLPVMPPYRHARTCSGHLPRERRRGGNGCPEQVRA